MKIDKLGINILLSGEFEDALLITPSLRALKSKYPNVKLTVFYTDSQEEVLRNNPNIDVLTKATFWGAPFKWILYRLGKFEPIWCNSFATLPTMTYSKNVSEIFAEMLDVELSNKRLEIFFDKSEEQNAKMAVTSFNFPIVIGGNSLSSKNKEWFTDKWEGLIKMMPEYTFIQVGLNSDVHINGAEDFRGRSFRESAAIIKHCLGFVGIDSYFAHAANAVGTPSVVLFGPTQPSVFGHSESENLYKKLRCSPCFEMLSKSRCPYGKECMANHSVKQVKTAILKKLNLSLHARQRAIPYIISGS